jgi:hypothetical protein
MCVVCSHLCVSDKRIEMHFYNGETVCCIKSTHGGGDLFLI